MPILQEIIKPYNSGIHSEEIISIGVTLLGNENTKFNNKIEKLIQEKEIKINYNQKEFQELKKKLKKKLELIFQINIKY